MRDWIEVSEIIGVSNDGVPVVKSLFVKVSSINCIRVSSFSGLAEATQLNLLNDVVWIQEIPSEVMDRCYGYYNGSLREFVA